jgi:outer membrane protein assembly factor BamB
MSVRALLLSVCLLVAGISLAGDTPGPNDWPQWRGQNRDGNSPETGLLKSWPKDGPARLWTAKGLGTGFATPSVAAGKIFGMGSRDGKDGVWALNEADGKELWFTAIDASRKTNQNIGPGSTPTYAAGKVYAVSNAKGVVAKLDAVSGKVEWEKSYVKDFGGGTPSWGFNDSVLVDGDKVICAPSSSKAAVAALKTSNGDVIWSTAVGNIGGGAGYSSPMKMTVGAIPTYVFVLGQQAGAVGVHADTGKLLWQYTKNAFGGVAQIPTPIISGDQLFISTAYGGGSAFLQLIPDGKDKITVEEIKSYKGDPMNHHGGAILIDGKVYFGHGQNNGIPVCYDFKKGKKVWHADRTPKLPGASGSAAYSYADGMLYVRYQDRLMTLVKPSPDEDENKIVSSFMLPEPNVSANQGKQSWAHPVIANGRLYLRDHNVLYCYNVKATTN